MATLTRCQQVAVWLTEALAIRHTLLIGGQPTRITHADKTLEFSAANRGDLDRYIAELQREDDACNGRRISGRAFRVQPSGW